MGMPERTNDAAGAYAQTCVSVAAECEIPVVDLWTKMQRFRDWERACLRYHISLHNISTSVKELECDFVCFGYILATFWWLKLKILHCDGSKC